MPLQYCSFGPEDDAEAEKDRANGGTGVDSVE